MKRFGVFAMATLAVATMSGPMAAKPAAVPTVAQQRAYTLSLMCVAVASYYDNEADKLRTVDALRKMGAAMGYDNTRIANDMTTMASVLGDELRSNPDAMEGHRASCRKIGLVS